MTALDYAIYDVFTDRALEENPLAVVFDAEALDTARMQAIAREFNLSETAFVLAPESPKHTARVRIFTPVYEMPFAGHPTVGSAIAISERRGLGSALLVLEENIGLVRCAVSHDGQGAAFSAFDVPQLPEALPFAVEPAVIAAAIGLDVHEIGFENHRPALFSAGVPYVTIPVAGLAEAARVRVDHRLWSSISPAREDGKLASAYVYCRETIRHDSDWHARMFVVGEASYEDPATGSAAAAFAGAIMRFDAPTDGSHTRWIEQGVEMGRPSRLRLELDAEAGELAAARIGGNAVKVAEGRLSL